MLIKKINPLLLCSLASGVLFASCFPKFNFGRLTGWFCLIPLFWSLSRAGNARQGAWLAFAAGVCGNLFIFNWIPVTLRAGGAHWPAAWTAWILLAAVIGVFWAGFGFCMKTAVERIKNSLVFAMAVGAAWVAFEFLRLAPVVFGGFPWCYLGYALIPVQPLAQLAEIGGVPLLGFLMVFTQALIWRAFCRRQTKLIALAALIVSLAAGWGAWRLRSLTRVLNRTLDVAVIQGNIYQYEKWDDGRAAHVTAVYREMTREANSTNPDLIVYPESFYPYALRMESSGASLPASDRIEFFKDIPMNKGTAYLGGLVLTDHRRFFNSVVCFLDGAESGIYSKVRLVPFGEYLPFRWAIMPVLRFFVNAEETPVIVTTGEVTPGPTPMPIEVLPGIKAGFSVCYEAVFPVIARAARRRGAKVLVNVTNDGWYLDTAAPHQHFLMNIARTIETRLPLIRAANTGISAVINPLGKVTARAELNTRTVLSGFIEELPQPSLLWAESQTAFPWLCLFFTGITVVAKLSNRGRIGK